jgi:8-oxo-dGTP diphosphatase
MNVEHPIQRNILLKLIHTPEASFTELQGDEKDSNKFAYHLSALEKNSIILKKDNKYKLSQEGKRLSSFIEGDTGTKAAFPTFAGVLIIKDGNRILAQKRLKEPFYGYWGLISGKINFGFNVEECAKRDLTEETGLTAEHGRLIGINQAKTFEDGKMIHHHIMFFIKLSGLAGELKEQTHKGVNRWMTLDEFMKKERFPDPWLKTIWDTEGFINIETERMMKDGKFVDCILKRMDRS